MFKYLIKTLGCQMNICDSDDLNSVFLSHGACRVYNVFDADVFILNTCSVRSQSEQKAFSYIGLVEKLKRQNLNIKIVVIGCMSERLGNSIKKRFRNIDLIVGTSSIDDIASKIINLCCNKNYSKKINSDINYESKIVSNIVIMRGCSNYCSYCVVPFVRGVEKNLDYDTIVNKCFSAVKNGIKEITFIGQNVNSYKCNGINFSLLLKNISLIKNLERIRFITNHPKDFSDELINTIATNSKICSHIHLPMQSASNKILQLMNRKYTYEYYLNLIKKLRFSIPDVNITTDIIVGFPGETREDFNCTLNAVKNLKFGWLYVFKYSRRQNTYAFDMNDNISVKEKEIRHFIILNEASKISSKITLNMVGNKYQVLVEKINGNFMESKTRNGYKVFLKINEKHYGKIVNVIVKNANTHSLFGNVIDE